MIFFDLDGVLLRETTYEPQTRALFGAVEQAHGLRPGACSSVKVRRHGRTDMQVARDLAGKLGQEFAYEATRTAYEALFRRLCPPDMRAQVAPGARSALHALLGRGPRLLTGNIRPVAFAKVWAAGIVHLLDLRQSGYGDCSEKREEILRLALGRLRNGVYICDTALDIKAGKRNGLRCFAVVSPEVDPSSLHEADEIFPDVMQAVRALL